jgi:hypothetical protein
MTEENTKTVAPTIPEKGSLLLSLGGHQFLAAVESSDLSLARIGGEEGLLKLLTTKALGEHQAVMAEALSLVKSSEKSKTKAIQIVGEANDAIQGVGETLAADKLSKEIQGLIKSLNSFYPGKSFTESVQGAVRMMGSKTIVVDWSLRINDIEGGSSLVKLTGSLDVTNLGIEGFDTLKHCQEDLEKIEKELADLRSNYEGLAVLRTSVIEGVKEKVADFMLKHAGINLEEEA